MGRLDEYTCGQCKWADKLSESKDVRKYYDEDTPEYMRVCYCTNEAWQGFRLEGYEACPDFWER